MKSDGAAVTENESSENRDEENELSDVRNEPEMNEYFSLDTQLQSGEPIRRNLQYSTQRLL